MSLTKFYFRMVKKELFPIDLQELAQFTRAISHPARLAILQYLAETKSCISGDISDKLPLSRTTVSQHLSELKKLGLIHGEIAGLKVNYCLCCSSIDTYLNMFDTFFKPIKEVNLECEVSSNSKNKI